MFLLNNRAQECYDARYGVLISILLYTRSPKYVTSYYYLSNEDNYYIHRVYKFFPAVFGVELWRQGTSTKAFQFLHHLGVCQGIHAARACTDRIALNYDQEVKNWKDDIEVGLIYCSFMHLCHFVNFPWNFQLQTAPIFSTDIIQIPPLIYDCQNLLPQVNRLVKTW